MEPFQIHAIVQVSGFFSILAGIYYAKKYDLRKHHTFVYLGIGLLTVGVAYMLSVVGGIPSTHGAFGVFTYLLVLFTALSGRLFLGRKLRKSTHRMIAAVSVLLLALQILFGTYSFLL